jgi:lipopolysaccharide transport system permease protein
MAVQISAIGLVFGLIFDVPMNEYLPFLTLGIIFWGFFSSAVNEASLAFISSETLLRQLSISPIVFVLKSLWKSTIVFGHNFLIVPIVFVLFSVNMHPAQLLFLPGLLLVLVSLTWIAVIVSIISVRFRDFPQIVSALLTVGFYVTPVIWQPERLPGGVAHLLLGFNPFYHLLQVLRLPLLGEFPTLENWLLSGISALVGSALAAAVYRSLKTKIAYWV